ncbi:PrgI family protein [Streptomyces profundus]|uniref:PrgI family protein n=1 Tax=Streptomyces profundus TaxID=2867410 RepID=UPI001D15EA47|nr:PrgI family protein [Streptomyces sp. MA3_2.13]
MSHSVRIPADIEREDRILGPLTARQTAIVGSGALLLYGGYWMARPLVGVVPFLVIAVPAAGALMAIALGRREGISMDRFALAALTHLKAAKRQVHAPEGVPAVPDFLSKSLVRAAGPPPVAADLPCRGVDDAGVLNVGRDGSVVLAECTSVNFGLRSAAEQAELTAVFARWLNSLTGPTQIVLCSHPVDLKPAAEAVHSVGDQLHHPELAAAARAHADYLARLGAACEVQRRHILVAARESDRRTSAGNRARQRLAEATNVLAGADIDARPLNAAETSATVRDACQPSDARRVEDGDR